jgi:hypothetical protein
MRALDADIGSCLQGLFSTNGFAPAARRPLSKDFPEKIAASGQPSNAEGTFSVGRHLIIRFGSSARFGESA